MTLDPQGPLLDPVLEGEQFNIEFIGDYTTIDIVLLDFPDTVTVTDNKIHGLFNLVFDLPNQGLKYRDGLDYGSVSQFNDLPEGADIYSYSPPVGSVRNYKLTVNITYTDIATGGGEQSETIDYILPVDINYSLYAQALRDSLWQQ